MTESGGRNTIRLSVIVASNGTSSSESKSAPESLSEFGRQCENVGGTELIVVDNTLDPDLTDLTDGHSDVRRIHRPKCRYTPELWAEGIRVSSGRFVALSTDQFLPALDWIASILDVWERADPSLGGIGGSIEQHPAGGLVDRAVYYVRYTAFMPPFEEHPVSEIAADNAVYRRSVIDRYATIWKSGFWEPDVHREMRKDGFTLLLTPHVRMFHARSSGIRSFMRNRFNHARQHGASRAEHFTPARRWAQILAAPVVPLVLTLRASRRVLARGESIRGYIPAVPLVLLFYASWAAGELVGTLYRKAAE